jgi:hypothetical protein
LGLASFGKSPGAFAIVLAVVGSRFTQENAVIQFFSVRETQLESAMQNLLGGFDRQWCLLGNAPGNLNQGPANNSDA